MSELIIGARITFFLSALLSIAGAALGLGPFLAIWWISHPALSGALSAEDVWLATTVAGASLVAKSLLLSASTTLSHAAAFKLLFRLRGEMTDRIAMLPQAVTEARGTADLRKLVTEDIDQIEDAIAHAIPDLAQGIAVPLLVFGTLTTIDWRLGIAAVALFPLLLCLYPLTIRTTRAEYGAWYAALGNLRNATRQLISGMAVIRAFIGPERNFERFDEAVAGARDTGFRAGTASLVQMSLLYTGLRGNVVVLIPVGSALFLTGAVSITDLILLLLLGLGLNASVLRLIFTAGNFSWRMKAAMARLSEIRATPILPKLEPQLPPDGHGLEFENVSLMQGDRLIVDGVTLAISPGQTLALVGPSGAGKTTLLRMLMRMMDPDAGQVRLGGTDLRQIPPEIMARSFAAVLQQAWLCDASIRENIRAGRPGASDAEVEAAAQNARVMEFSALLPQGLDSPVGEGGRALSGGERQRVAIARALISDAPILLLDEATAALDPENEAEVLAAFEALKQDRTVVVVAHRLHSIRHADHIAVMDKGRVIACGAHDELMANCPLYARLWQAYRSVEGWHLPPSGARPVPEAAVLKGESLAVAQEHPNRWLRLVGNEGRPLLRRALPLLFIEGLLMTSPVFAICAVLYLALGEALTPKRAALLTVLLLCCALVQIRVNQRACRLFWQLQTGAVSALQLRVARHLRRIPLDVFHAKGSSALEELITRHAAGINFVLPPAQAMKAFSGPALALLLLLWLDLRMAALALIGILPLLAALFWADRVNLRIWQRMIDANADLSARLTDWLEGLPTLRSLGLLTKARGQLDTALQAHRDAGLLTLRTLVPPMLAGWLAADLGLVLMLAGGGWLMVVGELDPAIWLLTMLSGLVFFGPLGDLFELSAHMRLMKRSMERVEAALSLPLLPEATAPRTPQGLEIRLENVGISRGGRQVLKGLNASFAPGQIHALTGPSGAGKSTILALIARYLDPDEGRITIGGVDLRQIAPELRESLFSVMFQDTFLFEDTVEANLRMARPGCSESDMIAATTAARCHELILSLPEGYQTRLGGTGHHLSGGERQRIALARAILKDAPIILLDEATASVDPENEAEIRIAIAAACRGRMVIVIAHRPETLRHTNTILRLERLPDD